MRNLESQGASWRDRGTLTPQTQRQAAESGQCGNRLLEHFVLGVPGVRLW